MNEDYILLADVEGEDTSRVCGRTNNKMVATAWGMGECHTVYSLPLDGEIKAKGYDALDLSEGQ